MFYLDWNKILEILTPICLFDEMLIDWVWLSQTGRNLALDPYIMTLSQIIPFWSSYQSVIT